MCDVVRDVLDKSVVDSGGRPMGRVDGIVVHSRPGEPLRLAGIVIGPIALGERVHPALGRLVRRFERWWGLDPRRPTEIDWADIEKPGVKIRVSVAIGETTAAAVEQRLRAWVGRIPGSR